MNEDHVRRERTYSVQGLRFLDLIDAPDVRQAIGQNRGVTVLALVLAQQRYFLIVCLQQR